MSWLTKISQLEAEPTPSLEFKLTLNDLRILQKFVVERSDMDDPGQGYFWDMPELQHTRRQPAETARNLQEIRKYFNDIFEEWGVGEHNIVEDKIDEDELNNEIDDYIDMYLQDYTFRHAENTKTWEFIDFIDDKELNEAWRAAFNFEQFLYNPGTSRKFFNRMMGEAKRWMEGNKAAGLAPNESVLQELVQEYIAYRDDPNGSDEPLLDKISEMTTEVMLGNIEYESSPAHRGRDYSKLPEEDVPFWIDWERLQEALTENFDDSLRQWYRHDNTGHYGGFQDSASDAISESRYSQLSEIERQFEHGYGIKPEVLFAKYDRDDDGDEEDHAPFWDDPRYAMELYMVQDIAGDLTEGDAANVIAKARTMASTAFLNVAAIQKVITSDPDMTAYFGDEAGNLQADPDTIQISIRWILGLDEKEEIPEGETEEQRLDRQQKKIDDMKERYDRIPNALRADTSIEDFMSNIMKDMQITEQELIKRHWKLRRETGRLTEEELARMQELGLARRPFPHRYVMERSKYPGAGAAEMNRNLHPFRITVSPEISADVIPPELFQTFSLHTMGKPENQPDDPADAATLPAMGWIGGYADYNEQVMYIMEVQSDLMQRTSHMRDPKKLEQTKATDIAQFQNKLTQLQRSLEQAQQGNPKQNMRQIIVRIQQENAALDPSSPKSNQNLSRIEQLETQLSRMPDGVQDTSRIEQQIAEVTQQLQEAQGRSTGTSQDAVYTKGDPAYWHDYKSKVENLFKDWVPIFFNVAVREAKRREFRKIRVIDASSLAKIWNQYSDKSTVELFKRVYDRTAVLRYNATHGVWNDYGFYEIDLQNPELRVAEMGNNWLQKIAQQDSATWLTVNPETMRAVWQDHIDAYFASMSSEATDQAFDTATEIMEGPSEQWDTGIDYVDVDPLREEQLAKIKDKRNIFKFWIAQVPPELKIGNDLSPEFKNKVRAYLLETQGFDPYQADEVDQVDIPSSDELEELYGG